MYKSDLISDTRFFLFGPSYISTAHTSYPDTAILTRLNQAIPKAYALAIEAGGR